MRILFTLATVFFSFGSFALAYNPIIGEPSQTYAVIPMEGDLYIEREYLGNLNDFPDLYEFTSEVAFTLQLSLRQRASGEVPFGLILVRQNENDGGVTEMVRHIQPLAEWTEITDSVLGVTFLEGATLVRDIEPGTYRIEVSSADNKGDYMLIVGDESVQTGFFTTLTDVYKIQRHFGYSPLRMLFSSYIYYLLGIIFVSCGIYYTWKYKNNGAKRLN